MDIRSGLVQQSRRIEKFPTIKNRKVTRFLKQKADFPYLKSILLTQRLNISNTVRSHRFLVINARKAHNKSIFTTMAVFVCSFVLADPESSRVF